MLLEAPISFQTITTEPSVESSRLLASKLQWVTGLVAFLAGQPAMQFTTHACLNL